MLNYCPIKPKARGVKFVNAKKKKKKGIFLVFISYNFKKSARRFPTLYKFTAPVYRFCDKTNFCQT